VTMDDRPEPLSLAAAPAPVAHGHVIGEPLSPCGRAARWSAELRGGHPGELWRLPAEAERVAARLVELGRLGVGGFAAAGVDRDGVWLARPAAMPTLAAWLAGRAGPVDGGLATVLTASVAAAAAACEQAALFPGAIEPTGLVVRGDAIELRGDALVAALVGEASARPAAPGRRWLAPEQAEGQPSDGATNRYAIGLVLYHLLAGEHPFAGRGLRRGLDDQAQRGAPPLPDPIASRLPPGLHSYCLRLLDPDPAARPRTAADIATHLRGMAPASRAAVHGDAPSPSPSSGRPLEERAVGIGHVAEAPGEPLLVGGGQGDGRAALGAPAGRPPTSAPSASLPRASFPPSPAPPGRARADAWSWPRAGRWRSLAWVAPLAAAAVGALWILGSVDAAPSPSHAAGPRAALGSARSLSDCSSCHPRQAAEWTRSVMAHAARSPLFQSLEILIEEQVGRDRDCPGGAGILREAGPGACRSRVTGQPITGSGGALWCVNCHTPGENLAAYLPAWDGRSTDPSSRRPLRDLLPASSLEGIGCAVCHQTVGPSHPGNQGLGLYEGNPSWTSPDTGRRFLMRPEDQRGLNGIGNSGYFLDPFALVARPGNRDLVRGQRHRAPDADARRYLASSEFCGACHDVRLFGTDALGGAQRGEHFKRLRNAYSEWAAWGEGERRAGREPASCQDCHMSLYPGVCVPAGPAGAGRGSLAAASSAARRACPPGTVFEDRKPGSYARGRAATSSPSARITAHYFSGVDVPLSDSFGREAIDDPTLDLDGVPLGASQRRDLLLARTFRLTLDPPRLAGGRLEVPLVVENIGAGHRVPAGFSQEREFWIHLLVKDARGRVVYEVGRVERGDQDLRDKIFLRVDTSGDRVDGLGRPVGLFGADVADGPDLPQWSPPPNLGGTRFRGRGLINLQNGFLRCVRCIGVVDALGRCQAGPGQEGRRAARYDDGDYDQDTGLCRSNLSGQEAFLETYFPVGALDAERGLVKGPDAIIDTRSAPPGQPLRYVYDLEVDRSAGPFTVEARLLFRAFPPFLVRAFIDYEAGQQRRGLRPGGPLVEPSALERLDVVEIAAASAVVR